MGETPQFPKIENGYYLIQYLQELSYGQYQNGSLMALDYNIIQAWVNLSGIEISFQEVKALISLSSSYVFTAHEAKDKEMKPPYIKE